MRFLLIAVSVLMITVSARAAGLLTPTDESLPPLRVTDHLVQVSIRDGIAITEVTQVFRNDTKRQLEATYVFPLPEQADLTDFQMSFNGKMVQGKVLPAAEARQVYEDIVRRLKDPGLIEFIGRRLLKMRVFPIEPESETTIKVRYQQICRPVSSMTGYHYPLRTRKTTGQAYGTVRFAVELSAAHPLKNIWSPTHAVEIVRGADEHTAKIAYEANGGSLNDDFLLLYDTASSDLGMSMVSYKPEDDTDGHFVLMLTPKQLWPDQEYEPQDIVFVLDTSGSMAGEKIVQAKSALSYCINSLDERDRFSVVRFSTGFDSLSESLGSATTERKAEAKAWVEGFTAAGGTNIADTLSHVVSMRGDAADDDEAERSFVVVFLTDGQGNREQAEIMRRMAEQVKEQKNLRMFPFGVGHDVNTVLLDRLAETYTGKPTYVQPGENLELLLGDFFAVVSRPVLRNLKLTLPEVGANERFPAVLGDLYSGQQLVLAGRFKEKNAGPVTLTAQRGGETVEYTWPDVSFTHVEDADYVPSVWAGRKIAYLIDQIRIGGESSEMIEEILALSQMYGIQTPYTSWLVNPTGETPVRVAGARRPRPMRPAPGPGGGAGMSRGGAPADAQSSRGRMFSVREAHKQAGGGGSIYGDAGDDAEAEAPADGSYGDEFGDIDLALAATSVTNEAGVAANVIARRNALARESRTKDDARLDTAALPWRNINGRWYTRMGVYLVDEKVGEDTEFTVVRFASDAYFELAQGRADLREALAANRGVVVMVAKDRAVLISNRVGLETFTEDDREHIGLNRG